MQHYRDRNRHSYVVQAMRALALLAIAVLAAGCGRAPGSLVFVDEAAALDRAHIEVAAAPLIALGVTPAVFSVAGGDDRGEDFTRRLDAAGLLRSGKIAPAVIALYVSFEPRYSELRAGADWSDVLPDAALRDIRLNLLNPALRNGDATGGVVAALVELDKHARFGPFGIRRDYATVALWLLIVAGIFLLVIGPRSIGDWLRWGPLGRFGAALWADTPPGRAQARRRFLAQLELAGGRTQSAAAEARATRQGMAIIPDDMHAHLERADQMYEQLEQRAPDAALPSELNALTNVYRQLCEDMTAFDRNLKRQAADMSNRAAQARERIDRVQNSFKRAAAPSRRAWKSRRAISVGGQQRLGELQARQALLDQQRAAFEQAMLSLAERQDRLAQLAGDYAALLGDANALWQAECPRDYAASISAPSPQFYESPSSSEAGYSSPSSTSSSSDYSSDWSSSSSSEPSSDGGTW